MTLLSLIAHCGKLINSPELFYQKENLEKLQKYVYYKFLYENNYKKNKNEEKVKEKDAQKDKEHKGKSKERGEEKVGEKGVDIIELKEDDDILMGFKGTTEV